MIISLSVSRGSYFMVSAPGFQPVVETIHLKKGQNIHTMYNMFVSRGGRVGNNKTMSLKKNT